MAAVPLRHTSFSRMQDATREDYQLIQARIREFTRGLPDRVLTHLGLLALDTGGYAVDRLTHSRQSATRALRDGRDEEYVVCALTHDIGDTLACANHSELAAVILQPFVSDKNHWIVKHHGIFQGYYFFHHMDLDRNLRDRYKEHEHAQDCAEFCELYDQNSFDRHYDTLPLEDFIPMVHRVFSREPKSMYWGTEPGQRS